MSEIMSKDRERILFVAEQAGWSRRVDPERNNDPSGLLLARAGDEVYVAFTPHGRVWECWLAHGRSLLEGGVEAVCRYLGLPA